MPVNVNLVDSRYQNAVTELQNRVGKLKNIVEEYQKIHDQADQCYRSDKTEELKRAIQDNINNINQSIGATEAQIQQYQMIQQNADTTNNAISGIVNTAIDAAKNIFD